jgi:hypothetical protein
VKAAILIFLAVIMVALIGFLGVMLVKTHIQLKRTGGYKMYPNPWLEELSKGEKKPPTHDQDKDDAD